MQWYVPVHTALRLGFRETACAGSKSYIDLFGLSDRWLLKNMALVHVKKKLKNKNLLVLLCQYLLEDCHWLSDFMLNVMFVTLFCSCDDMVDVCRMHEYVDFVSVTIKTWQQRNTHKMYDARDLQTD